MSTIFPAAAIGLSIAILAALIFVLGFLVLQRRVMGSKSFDLVEKLAEPAWGEGASGHGSVVAPAGGKAARFFDDVGRLFISDAKKPSEEKTLLHQAGYRAKSALYIFAGIRISAVIVFALLFAVLNAAVFKLHGLSAYAGFIGAAILGFLLPKFVLHSIAGRRVNRFNAELPFFVDMLALLQGVGLSLEQSLFSLGQAQDIGLPVIVAELGDMNRQVAAGRGRMDAMQTIGEWMQDPDFHELVTILRQVERFGGDVAGTLRSYSDRLQEKRRMQLRERIGKLTVKMTGVMVLTMLPALLMITAGPGFLGVFRALQHMTG